MPVQDEASFKKIITFYFMPAMIVPTVRRSDRKCHRSKPNVHQEDFP